MNEDGAYMRKEDFIDLIKVAEGIMTLEKDCKILSGVGFDEGDLRKKNTKH